MADYSNSKIPTTNIKITDVRDTLSESSTDLRTLCTSHNINMWSNAKPFYRPNEYKGQSMTEPILLACNYGLGILGDIAYNSVSDFYSAFKKGKGVIGNYYYIPVSEYHLGDFRGYEHKAAKPSFASATCTIPSIYYTYGGTQSVGPAPAEVDGELVGNINDMNYKVVLEEIKKAHPEIKDTARIVLTPYWLVVSGVSDSTTANLPSFGQYSTDGSLKGGGDVVAILMYKAKWEVITNNTRVWYEDTKIYRAPSCNHILKMGVTTNDTWVVDKPSCTLNTINSSMSISFVSMIPTDWSVSVKVTVNVTNSTYDLIYATASDSWTLTKANCGVLKVFPLTGTIPSGKLQYYQVIVEFPNNKSFNKTYKGNTLSGLS